MTLSLGERERRVSLARVAGTVASRLIALCLFAMGILYWSRLIGATGDASWRFDMIPVWWRMAAPVLAVLYPVAGAGVWMLTSWGVVIWMLVVAVEAVMHLGFPSLFGSELSTLLLHGGGLLLLLLIWLLEFFEQRRAKR